MSERFMELARDHQDNLEQAALANVRAKANEVLPPDWDGLTCYDRGCDIPKERLALGKFRCVECQTAKERSTKRR
jgi:hypothetical protein